MKNNNNQSYEAIKTSKESHNQGCGEERKLIEPIIFFNEEHKGNQMKDFEENALMTTKNGGNVQVMSGFEATHSSDGYEMCNSEYNMQTFVANDKTDTFAIARAYMKTDRIYTVGDNFIYAYNGRFYERISDKMLKCRIVYICGAAMNQYLLPRTVNDVYNTVMMEPSINIPSLTPDMDRVSFENCVLNIRNRSIEPHLPGPFIIYGVNGNYLGDGMFPTKVFDKFLDDITNGDRVLAYRILQMIGYILTPDTYAKKFFVLQGVPNSGKSVLTNLISKLLSENAVTTLDIHSYGDRFPLGELYGKVLAISPDLPAVTIDSKSVGKMKQITGNDTVSTDLKFDSMLSFRPTCTIMVATNNNLVLKERDDAFLSRAVTIPFGYTVSDDERNTHLLEDMLCEKDYIITNAINAYFNLVDNAYNFEGDYRLNQVVMNGSISERDAVMGIVNFAHKYFEYSSDGIVYMSDAYAMYRQEGGICSLNVFSQHFKSICEEIFGANKKKKRRASAENALSAICGIGWKV